MSAIHPLFPKDAIRYEGGQGRLLYINPATGAWVVTNGAGEFILDACDGMHTLPEVAAITSTNGATCASVVTALRELAARKFLLSSTRDAATNGSLGVRSLHLEVTNRCNLRCAHCYLSSSKAEAGELSFGEICGLVDQFAELLPKNRIGRIGITGGEARLRPDCLDILGYCRSKKLETVLFTNAVGLAESFVQQLSKLNVWVQVSLDGSDAKTNDSLRGRGTFRRIVQGIDLLCDHGFGPRMILFLTLTRNNIGHATKLMRFAERRKIGFLHFSQLNAQGRAAQFWRDLAPDTEQWVQLGRQLEKAGHKGLGLKGNVFGGLDMVPDLFPKRPCDLLSALRVDCQGNVYACQLFVGIEHALGNIRSSPVSEILGGAKARDLGNRCANRASLIGRCASCIWRPLCNGGCAGHACTEFGSLEHEDSFCAVRTYWFEAKAREILGLSRLPFRKVDTGRHVGRQYRDCTGSSVRSESQRPEETKR